MLTVHDVSYLHPDRVPLFQQIDLTVGRHDKIALIGNNGAGKSTLLKLLAGELPPTSGQIVLQEAPYLVPQVFGQYNHLTVAQALRVEPKRNALQAILNGFGTDALYEILDNDWTVEERCTEALRAWQLSGLLLDQRLEMLSGGQQTKVFLAGMTLHKTPLVLLDEPSNHLDGEGRELLYNFVRTTSSALVVVSHDRTLLRLLPRVWELSAHGLAEYGGGYDFYVTQKRGAEAALQASISNQEKSLRKAKDKQRESLERQQKLDRRGKGKQAQAGVARIMMNRLRNSAENSTAKTKSVHAEKIDGIAQELQALRATVPDVARMKLGLSNADLHRGKVLFDAIAINIDYGRGPIWPEPLTLQIRSGDRIALTGSNGSGKTSLLQLLLGNLVPTQGQIQNRPAPPMYIDQEYALIKSDRSVYEQAQQYNATALEEHEVKRQLSRFLFDKNSWDRPCRVLSGGERLRLTLCCLVLSSQQSEMLILDEPTNNLDLQNAALLTSVIAEYKGTLIVVSHDPDFVQEVGTNLELQL